MDISKLKYQVSATLQDGSTLDITPALLRLSWQDGAGEVAARASLKLAQAKTAKGYLHSLLPLCTRISVSAGDIRVFQGVVWEWEYSSGSSREISLTCYDQMIYAQNSRACAYYPAGKATKDIVADICKTHGISLDYQYESITHAAVKYQSTVSEQILDTLREAERQLKEPSVCLYQEGKLVVRKRGSNQDVLVFDGGSNTVSTQESLSLDGLLTKVQILGKESKAGRRPVEEVLTGKTEYGALQEVVYRDSVDTLAAAKAEAQKILDERGKPKHTISVQAPDVPVLRKGDKVKMAAGSLVGYYFVKGVTHQADSRTMTMELEK